MAIKVVEGPVIRAGQSLSEPLDCTAGQVVRIIMPDGWDEEPGQQKASLTFQVSVDGTNWNDLFDREGFEYQINTVVPDSTVTVLAQQIQQSYIKFRAGSRVTPKVQTVDRKFKVVLQDDMPANAVGPHTGSQGTKLIPIYAWLPGYGYTLTGWLSALTSHRVR